MADNELREHLWKEREVHSLLADRYDSKVGSIMRVHHNAIAGYCSQLLDWLDSKEDQVSGL